MDASTDIKAYVRQLLADPEAKPSMADVDAILARYPSFAFVAALLLARCPEEAGGDPDRLQRLQTMVMLASPDVTAMSDFANLAGLGWANFYPPAIDTRQKSTTETIDTFLETYSSETATEEDALLERLIFNPVSTDYLHAPEDEEASGELLPPIDPQSKEDDDTPAMPDTVATEPEASETREEPLLMESLAKIYIKQRRYERAFEIITNLNLKNPEKSIYFADQLRFLQKLMAIQRIKDAKN